MAQMLRSINLATKFQILVEVAANQPDIQQRDIAERLNLSPQAVSDYVRELVKDGWLVSKGRSKYSVTREGVDWMIKGLREWQSYSETVQKAIAGVSVCAAVADCDIGDGQKVGLMMRDGLLYATDDLSVQARGVAVAGARKGEDIGISKIDGIVPLKVGKVAIVRLPGIQKGGSRQADLTRLKKVVKGKRLVGALGIEALVALRKVGIEPAYLYGVKEAVVEAARSGLSPAVVCVEEETSDLLARLEEKGIEYEIVDVRKA
ncbi:MAG TPA: winged helix-turn-helix transcriptional regulator [Dehalococcoidia bacterium]|nr:winged helix-turn-helix transcriptional regulator [Dehalococcoidia bacterium]